MRPPSVQETVVASDAARGPLRVVTLGDSLAFGAGDESRLGLAGRLDEVLRAGEILAEPTINLGVNGAQTEELLARLRQDRMRAVLAETTAIVVSIGANDLFRTPGSHEETLRAPLVVAARILERIARVVDELHRINPNARLLILGGYNPIPQHPQARLIDRSIGFWDEALAARFDDDPKITIVRMSDLITPGRLSRFDSFHPGSAAYRDVARRIAGMLREDSTAAARPSR